jgi:hypothetical protein
MSNELIKTLAEVMGVCTVGRQCHEFLDDSGSSESEVDTSLIETNSTNSVWYDTKDLVNKQRIATGDLRRYWSGNLAPIHRIRPAASPIPVGR